LVAEDLVGVPAAHVQVTVCPKRNAARIDQSAGTRVNEDCARLARCGQRYPG
jgi:hypothetical protein